MTSFNRPRLSIVAGAIAIAMLASLTLFHAPASAGENEIVVTTYNDELDFGKVVNFECSLREAIEAARTNTQVDTCEAGREIGTDRILVPAGTYQLTINAGSTVEDANQSGDLDVGGNVEFVVTGEGNAVVDGRASFATPPQPGENPGCLDPGSISSGNRDRVFHVLPNANVTMTRFVIRGGYVDLAPWSGGGIFVAFEGGLQLGDSTVIGNYVDGTTDTTPRSVEGGGIQNEGFTSLDNVEIRQNSILGADAKGGGYNGRRASEVETPIVSSSIALNAACSQSGGAEGGGIATYENTLFRGSRLDDNLAFAQEGTALGGGMIVYTPKFLPNIRFVASLVEDNRVFGLEGSTAGGGIFNISEMTIAKSTVRRNQAERFGAGGQGGGIYNQGSLSITRSTLNGNEATQADPVPERAPQGATSPGLGGGVYSTGDLDVVNSTLARNEATFGGGVLVEEGFALLHHATVADNEAVEGGGVVAASNGAASVVFEHSIVADNQGGDCLTSGGKSSPYQSFGSNLDSDETCNLDRESDKPGRDPRLGELANNGGPTRTMALAPASPAVDAVVEEPVAPQGGRPRSCPPPETDQRGVDRPKDGDGEGAVRCDIGAFELKFTAPAPEACPGFTKNDPRNQIIGTPKAETLKGTNRVDIICGFKGNDTLRGFDGNDIILGGEGDDTLLGGDGADLINGDEGDDEIDGGGGSDKLKGRLGHDVVRGNDGGDLVRGGVGDDDVYGDAADDSVFGGIGADDMFGNGGNDRMYGKPGSDTMEGGNGNDRLRGGKSYDTLDGGDDRDRCHTQEGGGARINCELGE